MDLQLRNKRALVTGSSAGIGFAAAAGLHREGVTVVINGRTPERVEDAVARIRSIAGEGQVSGVVADLSSAEEWTASPGNCPRWTSWSTTSASNHPDRERR